MSATAVRALERERAQKEKWRAAAKEAREKLKEVLQAQKAAEKIARQMQQLSAAKEQAVQAFAEKWERKQLAKLAKQNKGLTVRKRGRPRRRQAAA